MEAETFSQWSENTQQTNGEHFDNAIKPLAIDSCWIVQCKNRLIFSHPAILFILKLFIKKTYKK